MTLAADPAGGGTVTGGGAYSHGQTATVNAVPSTGYIFRAWSDGGAQSHDVTVTSDMSLTATFEQNTYMRDYSYGPLITRKLRTYETHTGFANAISAAEAELGNLNRVVWVPYNSSDESLLVDGVAGPCAKFIAYITPSRTIKVKFRSNIIDDVQMSQYIKNNTQKFHEWYGDGLGYNYRGTFGYESVQMSNNTTETHHNLLVYKILVNGVEVIANDYYEYTLTANTQNTITYRFDQRIVGVYRTGDR